MARSQVLSVCSAYNEIFAKFRWCHHGKHDWDWQWTSGRVHIYAGFRDVVNIVSDTRSCTARMSVLSFAVRRISASCSCSSSAMRRRLSLSVVCLLAAVAMLDGAPASKDRTGRRGNRETVNRETVVAAPTMPPDYPPFQRCGVHTCDLRTHYCDKVCTVCTSLPLLSAILWSSCSR